MLNPNFQSYQSVHLRGCLSQTAESDWLMLKTKHVMQRKHQGTFFYRYRMETVQNGFL
ncbi:hypothetical protein Hanom_Chr03g00262741 [Helianthus anomalus]